MSRAIVALSRHASEQLGATGTGGKLAYVVGSIGNYIYCLKARNAFSGVPASSPCVQWLKPYRTGWLIV